MIENFNQTLRISQADNFFAKIYFLYYTEFVRNEGVPFLV